MRTRRGRALFDWGASTLCWSFNANGVRAQRRGIDMSWGVLIDREGEAWSADSAALRRRLMTDRRGESLNSFLVRSLGYVHISPRRSSCVVTLSERSAHPVAVVGTVQWMVEYSIERVALKWVSRPNSPLILVHRNHAIKLLGSCADAWAERAQRFSARQININSSAFAMPVAQLEKIVATDMDEQLQYGRLCNLLGSHFLISRRSGRSPDEFVVDKSGPALREYNYLIGRLERGMPLTAVQDKAYGEWIARSYSEAAARRTPVAHYVEATIGGGTPTPVRLSYQRLLFPYCREGEDWLLSSSAVSG